MKSEIITGGWLRSSELYDVVTELIKASIKFFMWSKYKCKLSFKLTKVTGEFVWMDGDHFSDQLKWKQYLFLRVT
jgi:hypothetical protein